MGYFSNLDIDREYCRVDRSYPTPAEQLAWKIEDLEERLDLMHSAAHSGRWCGGPAAAVRFKQRPKLVSYIRFNHHGVVLCCTL